MPLASASYASYYAVGTHLKPTAYERRLLGQFEHGQPTLKQVL